MSLPSFHKEHIVTWEDLLKQEKELTAAQWLFRGMQRAEWKLETSLERACKTYYKEDLSKAAYLENILTREFRRRYYNHRVGIPDPVGLEWLSLMQHYGAPTRLLDFTYSFFIAAFFAVEKPCEKPTGKEKTCKEQPSEKKPPDESCSHAVWAVRNEWVEKEGNKLLEKGFESLKKKFEFLECDEKAIDYLRIERNKWKWKFERQWELQASFFEWLLNLRHEDQNPIDRSQNAPLCVFPLNAMRLNERSTIQRGVFLCAGNVTQGFEANLAKLPGFDKRENLRKLVIPGKLRIEVLQKLHSMNINRASLFPGLEGFAASLGIYHPLAFGSEQDS